MEHKKVAAVLKEYFSDNAEVYEVALYAMSTLAVNESLVRALSSEDGQMLAGIPPQSYLMMKRFDNGLTKNEFWQEHYLAIKTQLALDDIKLNSVANYINFYKLSGEKSTLEHVKAIMLTRFDVLTIIALFYKGVTFAEEFDGKFRAGVKLTQQHEKFFNDNEVT